MEALRSDQERSFDIGTITTEARVQTFSAIVEGRKVHFNASTGDYRVAACKALDLAEKEQPATVRIWCENLLPDYGTYDYRIVSDEYGRLVVAALK